MLTKPEPASRARQIRVLMIHPKFLGNSFWSLESAAQLYGAEYPLPPLGLVTVAAMLPRHWSVRLIDRNVHAMTDDDILDADLIMTGGMLPQRCDLLDMIDRAQRLGKKVVVGGPDIMSSPEIYASADFQVLGEAEGLIDQFIEAFERGDEGGCFEGERGKVDVSTSPVPRFDLIDMAKYTDMSIQFSRGCPFTCEFCDIIELFGRVPRAKTQEQVLAELQAIYDLGHRGTVFFVDDNLIGNKKAVKPLLRAVIDWQEAHDYPFDFATEASINLADDDELLDLMAKAAFLGVFIGIETPDNDVLKAIKKKQNTRRDIATSIHKMYAKGMVVLGGFIVGFDDEKAGIGDTIAELIEEAAIPVAMAGLLYALPDTGLSRRLEREGRMHPAPSVEDYRNVEIADQATEGLNFETLRPRAEVLADFRQLISRTYDLDAYHRRVRRMSSLLHFDYDFINATRGGILKNLTFFVKMSWAVGIRADEGKRLYWGSVFHALRQDRRGLTAVFVCLAYLVHVRPFSRKVLAIIDDKIEALNQVDDGTPARPEMAPVSVAGA